MDNANVYSKILDIVDEASFTSYIFMCDLSTGKARVSTATANYFGFENTIVDDFKQCLVDVLDPVDSDCISDEWNSVINSEKEIFYMECRLRNVEGEYDSCVIKGRVLDEKRIFAGTIAVNKMEGIFDSITELYTFSEFTTEVMCPFQSYKEYVVLTGLTTCINF